MGRRLIDANALIAEYDRVHIGPPGGARKLMEDAPTIEQYGTWILCSERLPNTEKPYKAVLLQLKNSMFVGYTNKAGQWFVVEGDGYCAELNEKPVAWMPSPEPYREEKDDRD